MNRDLALQVSHNTEAVQLTTNDDMPKCRG